MFDYSRFRILESFQIDANASTIQYPADKSPALAA